MIAEQLYDKVYYYRNVIENPKEFVDLIESTENTDNIQDGITTWEEWSACSGMMYVYGQHKNIVVPDVDFVKGNLTGEAQEKVVNIIETIRNAFEKVCYDYAEKIGETEKPIVMQQIGIKKYMKGTFMGSHFDQQEGDSRLRYSLVMYLNDNYEGGEISFQVKDGVLTAGEFSAREDLFSEENNGKIDFWIKPEAGSVIIFPSTSPYSHTAHLVKSGSKYMVPGFWLNKEE